MNTLKEWIKEEAGDELVEAVVIGEMGWGTYNSENVPNYAKQPRGKVLSWDQAVKWLSYRFDAGYGSPECNAITAWTSTKVMFVVQYDGSTSLHSVPRHPVDHMPEMPGG